MMASKLARINMRAAVATRPPLRPVQRQGYHATSSAEGNRAGNKDWPWILGSAAVFVPVAYYVVSKTAHKHGEEIAHQADTSRNTLEKYEENAPNPAPWPENRENTERVESAKTYTAKEESPIDEISHDELISTIERELEADAPKTAKKAEEQYALKGGVTSPTK